MIKTRKLVLDRGSGMSSFKLNNQLHGRRKRRSDVDVGG